MVKNHAWRRAEGNAYTIRALMSPPDPRQNEDLDERHRSRKAGLSSSEDGCQGERGPTLVGARGCRRRARRRTRWQKATRVPIGTRVRVRKGKYFSRMTSVKIKYIEIDRHREHY